MACMSEIMHQGKEMTEETVDWRVILSAPIGIANFEKGSIFR